MAHSITVEFDEIPCAVINGADVGLTSVEAVISFDRDGWDVESISVEAFGKTRRMEVLDVKEHPSIYCTIVDAITDRSNHRRHVESQIDDWYTDQREMAAETRAEQRRAELRGW
jgi:hypothetical protein